MLQRIRRMTPHWWAPAFLVFGGGTWWWKVKESWRVLSNICMYIYIYIRILDPAPFLQQSKKWFLHIQLGIKTLTTKLAPWVLTPQEPSIHKFGVEDDLFRVFNYFMKKWLFFPNRSPKTVKVIALNNWWWKNIFPFNFRCFTDVSDVLSFVFVALWHFRSFGFWARWVSTLVIQPPWMFSDIIDWAVAGVCTSWPCVIRWVSAWVTWEPQSWYGWWKKSG